METSLDIESDDLILIENRSLVNRKQRSFHIALILQITFCLVVALSDAFTYHAFALQNAIKIRSMVHNPGLGSMAFYWCQFGAPLGVYLFALNNIYRWCKISKDASTRFRDFGNKKKRWIIFFASGVLGLLSVIPFYGMAQAAKLDYTFVLGNTFARYCMGHYCWYAVLEKLFDGESKGLAWHDLLGVPAFLTGLVTATYLFPFAKHVSGTTFAILAVIPTCLLWGLDAKVSWDATAKLILRRLKPKKSRRKSLYDADLHFYRKIILIALYLIVSAGAVSETMMAATNAHLLFYPAHFLTICAAIAFAGVYFTGPTQLTNHVFNYLQRSRNRKRYNVSNSCKSRNLNI